MHDCRYGHAAFANLYYSIEMDAPIVATVYGPKGRIHINHRAHNPESITLVLNRAVADNQRPLTKFAEASTGHSRHRASACAQTSALDLRAAERWVHAWRNLIEPT